MVDIKDNSCIKSEPQIPTFTTSVIFLLVYPFQCPEI